MERKKVIGKFLFNNEPFTLTHFESMLIRILFAIYFFFNYPLLLNFREQPYPHGLAQFFDLTFFGDPAFHTFLQIGTIVALMFYCIGRFMTISVIFLLIATIGPATLLYSQGYRSHGHHIIPLVLLGQFLAYAIVDIFKIIRGKKFNTEKIHNLAFYYTRQVIAYAYVVAAISKILATNGMWPLRAINIAPAVVKTHAHEYYGGLQTGLLERGEWISNLIVNYPIIFIGIFSITIFIEFFAFLAVFNRRLAFIVGIGLIIIHEGIKWTMTLDFKHNEVIIFLFFILPFLSQQISRWKFLKMPISKKIEPLPQKTTKSTSIFEYIPIKLTWCFVIIGLIVQEWFPFSAFPMYSNLPRETDYYYVTDENKKPIAFKNEFGITSATAGQMVKTRLNHQLATLGIKNEPEVGRQVLRYLLTIRESNEPPDYRKLFLWRVIISLNDKQLTKQEYQAASIAVP